MLEKVEKISLYSMALGLFICLTGMYYLPSTASYQKLQYLFLYLPAVIFVVVNADYRAVLMKSTLLLPVMGLLLLAALSLMYQGNEYGAIKHLGYIAIFFIAVIALEYKKSGSIIQILYASIVVAAMTAIYTLYHFYFVMMMSPDARLSGYGLLNNSILTGFVYGFFWLGCFASMLNAYNKNGYFWLALVCLVPLTMIVVQLQTRGGLLAVAVGAVVLAGFYRNRRAFIILSCLAGVFALVLFLYWDQIMARGVSYRPEIWLSALNIGMEHLWLGSGVETDFVIPIVGHVFDHPHSLYLLIFLELGLVGLLGWLALIALVAYLSFMSDLKTKGFAIALLAYSTASVITDGYGLFIKASTMWFVTWIPLAMTMAWLIVDKAREK